VVVADSPKTRYTRTTDGVHVAYEVLGAGPLDLIYIPFAASHLESMWEQPSVARWFRRLASFSRLVMFDKRGTGMSDRVEGVPTLEARMDDVRAVMDAVGSERAALCGLSEGGTIAALFAATYPHRVSSLVMIGSGASGWIPDPETQRTIDSYLEHHWGSGWSVLMFAPSVQNDERVRAWFGRWERSSASPGDIVKLNRMNAAFDIRAVLPTISTPTLVLRSAGDRTYSLEQGRYLAEHIEGARFVELAGADHAPWFEDPDTSLDLIEEFVTGERHRVEPDRVLATTMFTDIVDSTERASRVGDRRWGELLDQYESLATREVERFGGRLVKTTGDGTLATFDGPGRAVRCAQAMVDAVGPLGIEIRAGLHTGEVDLRGDDIGGVAVHIGQRVSALAGPSEVLVSRTVTDLVVGSGIEFSDRGEHVLKGVPGTWQLYAVAG
jgi:class 3 adenylate cyclase